MKKIHKRPPIGQINLKFTQIIAWPLSNVRGKNEVFNLIHSRIINLIGASIFEWKNE